MWPVLALLAVAASAGVLGWLIALTSGAGASGGPEQLLINGRTAFQAGQWAAALHSWQAASQAKPVSLRAHHARNQAETFLPLARAGLAAQQRRWSEADRELARARQAHLPVDMIEPVAQAVATGRQIDQLQQYFEQLLQQQHFDQAAQTLQVLAPLAPDTHPDRQARLDTAIRLTRHRQRAEAAEQAFQAHDYAAARQALQDALQLQESPDLHARLQQVLVRQGLEELLIAADRAERQEDYSTAAILLSQALRLDSSPSLQERLARAQAQALLQRAQQLRQTGQLLPAVQALQEALKHHPLPEATQLLQQIQLELTRQERLQQADQAFAASRWQEALDAYQQAAAIKPDELTAVRLRQCRYQLALASGDALLAQEQWEQAFAAYQDAKLLGDPRLPDQRLTELRTRRDYQRKLREADAYLQAGHFDLASRLLRQARQIRPGPEVDQRLQELRYQQHVDAARAAIAAENPALAISHLLSAKRYKSTPEVQALLLQLQPAPTTQPDR